MALASAIVWEVQTGGSDNNGGGFKAGASGVDRSQQTTAQVAIDNSTITTSITTTVITFTSGYSPSSNDVGNVVQMLTGTNVTAGFYEITSVVAGTSWTVDRNVVTSGTTTNATGNMGGCLATVTKASGAMAGSNTAYVKNGTYTITTTITPPSGAQGAPTRWIGYNATRGDLDQVTVSTNFPTIRVNNTAIVVFTLSNPWQRVRNFILDAGVGATKGTRGINSTANYNNLNNIRVQGGFTAFGIAQQANGIVRQCYVTGMASGATAGIFASLGFLEFCCSASGQCQGYQVAGAVPLAYCLAAANAGATSHGFAFTGALGSLRNSVSWANGGDGVNIASGSGDAVVVENNVLMSNGGYGLKNAATLLASDEFSVDYNAYYNNTSGSINGLSAGAHDVTLSGDPFTNAAGGDYSLNSTAGAGAACRASGIPGVFLDLSTTGYIDIGMAQHADSASGGGGQSVGIFGG